MSYDLTDAWSKIRRAQHHLDALRVEIERWRNANPHRIVVDKHLDESKYAFRVEDLQPAPPEWGLIVGDCVHNARTSLDHLMVNLVAAYRGVDPGTVADIDFPVYDSPKRLNGALGELRKELSLSGYLTRIEELQPYNFANPSIWGTHPVEAFGAVVPVSFVDDGKGGHKLTTPEEAPAQSPLPHGLLHLTTLDNIDKHRVIHRPGHSVKGINLTGFVTFEEPYEALTPPTGYEIQQTSRSTFDALKNGAEVGHVVFASGIDGTWTPSDMEMLRHFPIETALRYPVTSDPNEFVEPREVIATLRLCIWSAATVLRIFEPVFARPRKPPLSVMIALPNF